MATTIVKKTIPAVKKITVTAKVPAKKTPAKKIITAKAVQAITTSAPASDVRLIGTPKPIKSAKPAKPTKPAKPKLVRDSFTIPKDEYQVLADLKLRLTKLMQPAKKSELLRAGLKALTAMSDATIKMALQAVPSIKTGRPAKIVKK
jgi:hypothetical protein